MLEPNFKIFNKKNILITGGTGSFGSNFIKILLKKSKPDKIICFSKVYFIAFRQFVVK